MTSRHHRPTPTEIGEPQIEIEYYAPYGKTGGLNLNHIFSYPLTRRQANFYASLKPGDALHIPVELLNTRSHGWIDIASITRLSVKKRGKIRAQFFVAGAQRDKDSKPNHFQPRQAANANRSSWKVVAWLATRNEPWGEYVEAPVTGPRACTACRPDNGVRALYKRDQMVRLNPKDGGFGLFRPDVAPV